MKYSQQSKKQKSKKNKGLRKNTESKGNEQTIEAKSFSGYFFGKKFLVTNKFGTRAPR